MDNKKTFALIGEIMSKSISTDWHNAKVEWVFKHYYESDEPTSCLCGHYPITRIMVYENKNNKNVVELGICCSEKLLSSEYENEVIKAYVRLKKDINKSMGAHAFRYCIEKQLFNQKSIKFYSNTMRKRKMSKLQMDWRVDLNHLFMKELTRKHKQEYDKE